MKVVKVSGTVPGDTKEERIANVCDFLERTHLAVAENSVSYLALIPRKEGVTMLQGRDLNHLVEYLNTHYPGVEVEIRQVVTRQ